MAGALLGLVVGARPRRADGRSSSGRSAAIPFERVDPAAGVGSSRSCDRARRDARGRPRAGPSGRLDPAGRGAPRARSSRRPRGAPGSAGSSPSSSPSASRGCSSGRATSARTGFSGRPPSTSLLLGAVLVAPVVLGALGRIAGLPFRLAFRPEERLARAAIVRDRSRTTLTVGALAIGLAMVVAIGAVADQSRLAAAAWLEDVIPGDELLTSIRPIALDEDVIGDVAAIDGVARVSPIASFDVARDGVRLDAAAVRGSDLARRRPAAVRRRRPRRGARRPRRRRRRRSCRRPSPTGPGLTVGSTLTLAARRRQGRGPAASPASSSGRCRARSARRSSSAGRTRRTSFGVAGADVLAVRYEPGAEATARPAGRCSSPASRPSSRPRSRAVAGAVDDALGQVFGLFDALALVAVLVAALGIVNTLTIGVLERVREIGVLRAAGMTRDQVRRTVVVEAGILGLVGAVLGIVTGLVWPRDPHGLAPAAAPADPRRAVARRSALAVVLGVGVSMLAAWYPARLASRLAIVAAVQHE